MSSFTLLFTVRTMWQFSIMRRYASSFRLRFLYRIRHLLYHSETITHHRDSSKEFRSKTVYKLQLMANTLGTYAERHYISRCHVQIPQEFHSRTLDSFSFTARVWDNCTFNGSLWRRLPSVDRGPPSPTLKIWEGFQNETIMSTTTSLRPSVFGILLVNSNLNSRGRITFSI